MNLFSISSFDPNNKQIRNVSNFIFNNVRKKTKPYLHMNKNALQCYQVTHH